MESHQSQKKTYIKFNKRISPKVIQFIITAGKGKKITLSLDDFTVSERGESGGDLSISKITKEINLGNLTTAKTEN